MTTYMSGSLVRATGTFLDINGAAADPTTVTLKYKKDAASTTTLTYAGGGVTKTATGVYHVDLDTTGWAGPDTQLWTLEWIGTGTVVAIATDSFKVSAPAL